MTIERLLQWSPTEQPCMTAEKEFHADLKREVCAAWQTLTKLKGNLPFLPGNVNNLLIQISSLTRFMEMTECCSQVCMLQNDIKSNRHLSQTLVLFLGHSRQQVRYSSCKLLCALLVQDVNIAGKLQYLSDVNSGKISLHHEQQEDTDQSNYHRLLMTFDLLRLLLKMSTTPSNASSELPPSCICDRIETPKNVDALPNILQAAKSLSFMSGVLRSLLTQKQCAMPEKNFREHDVYRCLRKMQPQKIDILFIAYLKLLKSFVKRTGKEFDDTQRDVINFLVDAMADTRFSRISLRLSVDIVTLFLQKRLEVHKEEDDTSSVGLLTSTAHRLCDLCTEEWLHSLPYHSGPVGFGGVEFADRDNLEQQPVGDTLLLRKLTRMILAAALVITDEVPKGPSCLYSISSSLQHLQKFVGIKQGTCSPEALESGGHDWLVDLFADDDDDQMVLILLHTLKVYKNVIKTLQENLDEGQRAGNDRQFLKIPNPHRMLWTYLGLIDRDHSVLLDLLMSSETEFLEYFTCYLHLLKSQWLEAKAIFRELHEHCNSPEMPEVGKHSDMTGADLILNMDEVAGREDLVPCVDKGDECSSLNQRSDDSTFSCESNFEGSYPGMPTIQCAISDEDGDDVPDVNKMQYGGIDKDHPPRRRRKTSHEKQGREATGLTEEKRRKKEYDDNPQLEERSASGENSGASEISGVNYADLTIESKEEMDINHGLDNVFTVLIRLRLSLERLQGKNMFPYSITPLVNLLEDLEALYEA